MLKGIKILILIIFISPYVFGQTLSVATSSANNSVCGNSGTCSYTGPAIVFNEIRISPVTGEINSMNEGHEFIELYNPNPCDTVDISCYILASDNDDEESTWSLRFPKGTKIAPLGFLTIGGTDVVPTPDILIHNFYVSGYGSSSAPVVWTGNFRTPLDYGSTLTLLKNDRDWKALYNASGSPVCALAWGSFSDNISCLNVEPEYSHQPSGIAPGIVSDGCTNVPLLQSAKNIYNNYGSARMIYLNKTYGNWSRSVDGTGSFVYKDEAISAGTPDNCNATCATPFNSCTGTASVTVTGGSGNYSYLWDTDARSQITATANSLCGGCYNVTVTDNNSGNTADAIVCVSDNGGPTISETVVNISCNGDNNGSVDITLNPLIGPYTYDWNDGLYNTEDISSLTGGDYYINIVNTSTNCTSAKVFEITEPSLLQVNMNKTDVSVHGNNDGTATANVSGGTLNYDYLWDSNANNQTTAIATGLTAGNYSVTVTDSKGCSLNKNVTITEPNCALSLTSNSTNPCAGTANGTASINVSNGIPNYTYIWAGGSAVGQTTNSLINLAQGNYSVTATDDAGCTISATFNLTDYVVNVGFNSSPNQCLQGNSFNFTNTGSSIGGETYSWTITNGIPSSSSNENPTNITWAGTGTYSVSQTITLNGCSETFSKNIAVFEHPSAIINKTDDNCSQCIGAANLVPSNGTTPYAFLWNNSNTSQNLTDLCGGNYQVTITDDNNCTATANTTINDIGAVTANFTASSNQCLQGNSFNFTNTGNSIGGEIYSWTFANGTPASSSNENPTNITWSNAGTYTVTQTITLGGCSDTYSYDITVFEHPTVTVNKIDDKCNKCIGEANIVVSNGITPYSFLWNNSNTNQNLTTLCGGNYQVTVTDDNGCTVSAAVIIDNIAGPTANINKTDDVCGKCIGSANVIASGGTITTDYIYDWNNSRNTQTISNLCNGTYSVTVTDDEGCSVISQTNINNTQNPQLNVNHSDISCFGIQDGSAIASVTGATGVVQYNWNGSNSFNSNQNQIQNLTAGTYSLTITDDNLCSASETIQIQEPLQLTINLSHTDINCYNECTGQIIANVNGGTLNYSYLWSNNSQNQDISNLCDGNYSVTVTDANDCTTSENYILASPNEITYQLNSTPETCGNNKDGSVSISNIQGGVTPYQTIWNAATNNLEGGFYYITITDNNNCIKQDSIEVEIIDKPQIDGIITHDRCNSAIGSITTNIQSNNNNIEYLWLEKEETTSSISNLKAGEYTLRINDNGCIVETMFEVENNGGVKSDFYTYPSLLSISNPFCNFYETPLTWDNSNIVSTYWDFGDKSSSSESNPVHEYKDLGIFNVKLIVIDQFNCSDTAIKNVEVKNNFTFYMPNAFTPDEDGINENLGPSMTFIDEVGYEFRIYDRWGYLVYFTDDIYEKWNGRFNNYEDLLPQGTYVWYIKLIDLNNQIHQMQGHISLIRK